MKGRVVSGVEGALWGADGIRRILDASEIPCLPTRESPYFSCASSVPSSVIRSLKVLPIGNLL